MTTNVTESVMAIGQINLAGNITPANWWRHIKLPSGRPDQTAITLLSEIVYWYRPAEVRNEATGELTGYRKRFRGDKLQRSYQSFADQFGFGKRETTDALKRLRDAGLITLELRSVDAPGLDGVKMHNVLFVEPVAERIADITNPSIDGTTPTAKRNTPSRNALQRKHTSVETEAHTRFDVSRGTSNVDTNTETVLEIGKEIKNNSAGASAPAPTGRKKTSFDPAKAKPENVSEEIWQDWVKFRREIHKPLTETTCTHQVRQLAGHQNADEVIRRSIAGGWQGLFPEKVPNKPSPPAGSTSPSRTASTSWCTPAGDGSSEVFVNYAALERSRRGYGDR